MFCPFVTVHCDYGINKKAKEKKPIIYKNDCLVVQVKYYNAY